MELGRKGTGTNDDEPVISDKMLDTIYFFFFLIHSTVTWHQRLWTAAHVIQVKHTKFPVPFDRCVFTRIRSQKQRAKKIEKKRWVLKRIRNTKIFISVMCLSLFIWCEVNEKEMDLTKVEIPWTILKPRPNCVYVIPVCHLILFKQTVSAVICQYKGIAWIWDDSIFMDPFK